MIFGKGPFASRHIETALSTDFAGKLRICREFAVLRWYALAAHAGNLALFVLIHGGETALGPVCASIFFAVCAHNHQLIGNPSTSERGRRAEGSQLKALLQGSLPAELGQSAVVPNCK